MCGHAGAVGQQYGDGVVNVRGYSLLDATRSTDVPVRLGRRASHAVKACRVFRVIERLGAAPKPCKAGVKLRGLRCDRPTGNNGLRLVKKCGMQGKEQG